MNLLRLSFLTTALVAISLHLLAADNDPKTLMTDRGKLQFSDDLNQPPSKQWRIGKGKWEAADGAVRGCELKSDMHGAVARVAKPFRNTIIAYSFKLDGARTTTLSINKAQGHLCRVVINATGFAVQKDGDKQGEKPVVFERKTVAIAAGEWHTIVVELLGKEMLGCLDGKHIAFGEHEALDANKANFGLTVAGESASFKNFRMWEATPNKEWAETKSKLLAARAK
jgi:hypothetical protein